MKKKIISLILAAVMILTLLPTSLFTASAASTEFNGITVGYENADKSTPTSSTDMLLTYKSSGTLTVDKSIRARLLIVGGGGSGSSGYSSSTDKNTPKGGGGFGGGVVDKMVDLPAGSYAITVGAGGSGVKNTNTDKRAYGENGGASSIYGETFALTATGGAGGGDNVAFTSGGISSDITGKSTAYGKDGATKTSDTTGTNGEANTGNGGEGGYDKNQSGSGGSGIVFIRIIGHSHEFTYSVDPDDATKLIATCTKDDCNITDGKLSVSLTGQGVLSGLDKWKKQGAEEPVITYYNNDGSIHEGDCFEEGDYTVKATVGDAVAQLSFTIGSGHYHIINGSAVKFTAKNTLPTTAGNYYLSADITRKANWSPGKGDTRLCLNGHTISFGGKDYKITVKGGRTLTIFDCGKTEHYFKYSTTDVWKSIASPSQGQKDAAITLSEITDKTETGAVIKVIGGVITGASSSSSGGVIYVTGDKTNGGGALGLYGGNIVGNTAGSYSGGAVYIEKNSTLDMYGGAILGNYAGSAGGGVYSLIGTDNLTPSLFNMYGGVIGYNISGGNGGGVASGGRFNMYGGEIVGNRATSTADYSGRGGGVRVLSGDFVMTGGIIHKNIAQNGGGIQYAQGTIYGNIPSPFGGSATFGGTAVVRNNCDSDGKTQNVLISEDDNYGGQAVVTLAVGDEAPRKGMDIGVHKEGGGVFSFKSPIATDCIKYFSADNVGYTVTTEDDRLTLKNLTVQYSEYGTVYNGTESATLSPNNRLEIVIDNTVEDKNAVNDGNVLYIGAAESYQFSNINAFTDYGNVRWYMFSQNGSDYQAMSEYDLTDKLTPKGEKVSEKYIKCPTATGESDIVATKFIVALYRELIEKVNRPDGYDKIFLSFNGDMADGINNEDDCQNIAECASALGYDFPEKTDEQILNELKAEMDRLYAEEKIVWITPSRYYGSAGYTSESAGNFAKYILGGYEYQNPVQMPQMTESEFTRVAFQRYVYGYYKTLTVEDTLVPGLTVKQIIPQINEYGVWYDIPAEGYNYTVGGNKPVIKATAETGPSDDGTLIKAVFDLSEYQEEILEHDQCAQPDLRVRIICEASDEFVETYMGEDSPDFDNTNCKYEDSLINESMDALEYHIDSPDITAFVSEITYTIVIPKEVSVNSKGLTAIGKPTVKDVENADGKIITYTADGTEFIKSDDGDITVMAEYYTAYTDADNNTPLGTESITVYDGGYISEEALTALYVFISDEEWENAENGTYHATVTYNFEAKEE